MMPSISRQPCILLAGSCEDHLADLLAMRKILKQLEVAVLLVDIGKTKTRHELIDISSSKIRLQHYKYKKDVTTMSLDDYNTSMVKCCLSLFSRLQKMHRIHGVLALGKQAGTILASMPAHPVGIPVGFPQVVLDDDSEVPQLTRHDIMFFPYIGPHWIPILTRRRRFESIALLILSQANAYRERKNCSTTRYSLSKRKKRNHGEALKTSALKVNTDGKAMKRIGITFPRNASTGAYSAKKILEDLGHKVLIFYPLESGGTKMEHLIRDGHIDAVLDLTTYELAQELICKTKSIGTSRLTVAGKMGIPQVVSPGGLDFIHFAEQKFTLERLHPNIKFHVLDKDFTVARTSPEECAFLGEQMAIRLKDSCKNTSLVHVMIPKDGFSSWSRKFETCKDSLADSQFVMALERGMEGSQIGISNSRYTVDDSDFGREAVERLLEMMAI